MTPVFHHSHKKRKVFLFLMTMVSLEDAFTGGMKSPERLHIIVNCMKNIEAKIKKICEMNQVTQNNQIKGECRLKDLVESIEFYNDRFDELERNNRKKGEKINELEENTKKMDNKIEELKRVIDSH